MGWSWSEVLKSIVVQSPSRVRLFMTPWTAAHEASFSLTISQSLLKFMSIALVMPSSHLIFWCSVLLLPSIFPSIRDFSNESAVHIRWPKYWSFSFSISPSNEYSGLSSLKIEWFDLLAVQGTLTSHIFKVDACCYMGFPGGTSGKEPACQCRRCKWHRFNPWVGKIPERGHGNPLQHSSLGNPMDRGAWQATVHRVGHYWSNLACVHTCCDIG